MNTRSMRHLIVVLACAFICSAASHADLFGAKGKDKDEKRDNVRKLRDETLADLYAARPKAKEEIANAVGYATFRMTDVNLFLLASGNGYGVLVDNRTQKETFMRVASLGGGVGMGVKDLRVVFIFNDEAVMKTFVDQGWQFGGKADASAKYEDTGVSAEQSVKANVNIKDGSTSAASSSDVRAGKSGDENVSAAISAGGPMEVYQFTESGVSLQATVAGTKYWKDDKLNN